jgi:hypothetical protein
MAATNEIAVGVSSSVDVSGGNSGDNGSTSCRPVGGGGEGGNVRLVTRVLSGTGTINLTGGQTFFGTTAPGGRIRIEANTNAFTGSINGPSGGSFTQFPNLAIPADLPTLRITSIGGVAVPAAPTGSLSTPDVSFASPPTNPVIVGLAATQIPIGTVVSVRITPGIGTATTANSTSLTGTVANSTATASVNIPPGAGAITATATFTLPPQGAMLLGIPNLDRTKPAQVEVVADAGGASRVYVIADNGARFELGMR